MSEEFTEEKGGEEATSPSSLGDFYTEPEYDISEVRRALRRVLERIDGEDGEEKSAAYCAILTTLGRIAANVLRVPVTPAHLSINLRNPAIQRKFGASIEGARDFLVFCGFCETGGGGAADEPHTVAMPLDQVESNRVRIERAIVILNAVLAEHAPPPNEDEPMPEELAAAIATAASAAAPSSVFLANSGENAGDDDGQRSPQPDEEMKPDLEPTYNIGEVRTALKLLYNEVEATIQGAAAVAGATAASSSVAASVPSTATPFLVAMHNLTVRDSVCQVLDTLCKITQNLTKAPVNPQHLRINLANPAVLKKFAQYQGAVDYLRFLGFATPTAEEALAAPPTPTSAEQQLIVLSESELAVSSVKVSRALSILMKLRADTAPTAEENERRALGPVDRDMRVFDMTVCLGDPRRTTNTQLGASDEVIDETKADMALLLSANAAERKRVHDLARTDVIITKQRQAEIKEAGKRKYHKTLIKITFTDKSSVMAPQGQGRYSNKRSHGGHVLGFKALAAQQAAQAAADGPAPMELDDEEEKGDSSSLTSPVSVSSPPTPAAEPCISFASPTPAAPAIPAPEVLLTAYFRPWETLGDLFAFVQSHLVHGTNTDPFYLHLPPTIKYQCGGEDKQGKHAALLGRTLQSLGLVPAASMFFHYCSTSSAADVPTSVIESLHPDVLVMKTGYDIATIAALIPTAINIAELDAAKARALAEARERERATHAPAASSSSPGAIAGGADEDDDIEAYMRRKKAASAKPAAALSSRPGNSLGGSSGGSAGSAASKRVIPGLFKPKK